MSILKKSKTSSELNKIVTLATPALDARSASKNGQPSSYGDTVKSILNKKAKPNENDSVLEDIIKFVIRAFKTILNIFTFCLGVYLIIYTLATIFPFLKICDFIDTSKMEKVMQSFIHNLGLLSGWILYLVDKFRAKHAINP